MSVLPFNPWTSMWTKPRETIRFILAHNPRYRFFILSSISGWVMALQIGKEFVPFQGASLFIILLSTLMVAPFLGVALFSFVSCCFWVIGKWLGGKSSFLEMRCAVSWAHITSLFSLVSWLFIVCYFKESIFCANCAAIPTDRFDLLLLIMVSLLQNIFGLWTMVLLVFSFIEIQGFSIGKAFLNLLLPFLIVLGTFWVLGCILGNIESIRIE